MKYLSQTIIFSETISDPEIIAGTKNATIEIDFGQLTKSDTENGTKYVVGGRTYWEATLFGDTTTSFTTKGFFDKLGYVEPTKSGVGNNTWEIWVFSIIGAILFVLLIVCCCKCSGKKSHMEADDQKVHAE